MLVSRLEILNETHPASKKACSQGISFSQQHLLAAMNNKVERDLIPITFNAMGAI